MIGGNPTRIISSYEEYTRKPALKQDVKIIYKNTYVWLLLREQWENECGEWKNA